MKFIRQTTICLRGFASRKAPLKEIPKYILQQKVTLEVMSKMQEEMKRKKKKNNECVEKSIGKQLL